MKEFFKMWGVCAFGAASFGVFLWGVQGVLGCGANVGQIAGVLGPIVENAACELAADQGNLEPGWERYVCNALDPVTGAPVPAVKWTIETLKGAPPRALRGLPTAAKLEAGAP